jgi:hypothetical protein
MRRVSLYAVLALLLCAFVSPSQSRADGTDSFTLSDGLGNTFVWQLPASPTPTINVCPGSHFELDNVLASVDGIGSAITLVFTNQNIAGGALADGFPGTVPVTIESGGLIGQNAPQFYSGQESAPTFLTGTFLFPVKTFEESFGLSGVTTGTLTITSDVASVPEPSTLLLLAIGLLGMGAIIVGKLR